MSENKKNYTIKSIILYTLTIISLAVIVFGGKLFNEESIFYQFENSNAFIQGLVRKIPALIKVAIIIVLSIDLFRILRLFSKLAFKKNKRMMTIISLFSSLLKWLIFLIAFLLILNAFGVDTTTLLASAGLLTLVIGLGAQPLINDIISGIFLVFEGEYEVGDFVSIDGWRGIVKEIGIRVTKIEDVGGNIKTINNSDVKNVVNLTKDLSLARILMPIDYAEDLERVEKIIKDSAPEVKDHLPAIAEGPFYLGVYQLADSSVDLLITAKCKESDIYQLQRDLTREYYLIFTKNNVQIPFNQLTVSMRDQSNKIIVETKNDHQD